MYPRLPEQKEVILTERELQVCALVAEGLPNKTIAARLKHRETKEPLTEHAVHSYLQTIFLKTQVNTRAALVSWLYQKGFLRLSPAGPKRR